MLLPKLGGSWLLPPRDFPHLNESHPMDHDSDSSGHAKIQDLTPHPDGWTRESVVGELGLFADEEASGDGEAASAKSAED